MLYMTHYISGRKQFVAVFSSFLFLFATVLPMSLASTYDTFNSKSISESNKVLNSNINIFQSNRITTSTDYFIDQAIKTNCGHNKIGCKNNYLIRILSIDWTSIITSQLSLIAITCDLELISFYHLNEIVKIKYANYNKMIGPTIDKIVKGLANNQLIKYQMV